MFFSGHKTRCFWSFKKTLEVLKLIKNRNTLIFFHPDCTVGFGIAPNHAILLVDYTTGRDFNPALKIKLLVSL